MFRKYPYWGWLLLALLLWCINGYNYRMHRNQLLPQQIARTVTRDLQQRENAMQDFLANKELINRAFLDSLSENEALAISKLPFYVYGYAHDTLRFWSTNILIAAFRPPLPTKPIIRKTEKGIFIEEWITPPGMDSGRKLAILYPLLITYHIQNDYLKSHFLASEYIPATTRITPTGSYVQGAYPVYLRGKEAVLYLHLDNMDVQKWVPDTVFLALLLMALLASISWVHLMTIYLTANRSKLVGLFITLGIIITFRSLLYMYGLPYNLHTLPFFSPQLYASSQLLPSFGDLFINTLCILWLVVFVTRHTPYKTYCTNVVRPASKLLLGLVILVAMIAYVALFVAIIRSLILDSSISFDLSHFYSVDAYTILGLLVIGAITGISCLIIYLLNVQLQVLIGNKWLKYAITACLLVLALVATGYAADQFARGIALWLVVYLFLLDIRNFALVSDLFEPHMIFWAVFIGAFCTTVVKYFNEQKEHGSRVAYVTRLTEQRDNVFEYAFDKVANKIALDKQVKDFINYPTLSGRRALNKRFDTLYLSHSAMNNYDAVAYIYNAGEVGLYNRDTLDMSSLMREKSEASPTNTPYLFYKESILDRNHYLSYIRIYSDTINQIIGHIVVDLSLKREAAETVYPELLQPITNKVPQEGNEYAHALYINNKLITQTNDYPFTTYLTLDTLKEQQHAFYEVKNVSELHYKVSENRTLVVVHYHSELLETITLFSYLFGMEVLLAVVILIYQLYLSYFTTGFKGRFLRLTLRRRVHFSMVSIVLVSFFIIGTVTILFFTNQYRSSNSDKLRTALQVARQSVQDYLRSEHAYDSDYMFEVVSRSPHFREFVASLARSQKIDINVFDYRGILSASSQEAIYDKGLISRLMRPDAFYRLDHAGISLVIQNERVGKLWYLSAYQPLRDEQGITLGYINVPFFSSEKDLNFQISNIVITLINVYAFIFLLSSVITVFITRWITGTFNVIIEQFGRLNLQRNERINWPYEDEIGLLVSEYNKMVNKVEENAALLAQSERESAWREMARQVAHEIKNPLTPMKLNIQYLRQAMKNDQANIKDLTERVSASIIEQIDNLSYIASEFSNFAKMPEARPEELDLRELLQNAAELYLNDPGLDVSIVECAQPVVVLSDHSQLLRVCTNLLENAKQAIPEDRNGRIEISLSTTDGYATIAIKDNGIGISEEVATKIFKPYFTTKSSGTGLGLAMTRKIIEFWKGEIWFETIEDEGTTFFVKLPMLTTSS